MSQILLVEDDPIVRLAYTKVLRTSGLELDTASNGAEALEKVRHGQFDAVVSDINMPGLSGIELLRAVRELSLDVPVVLVTDGPALETAVRAVEYGAYRYLTKPVDIDALRDTVHRAAEAGERARRRRETAAGAPLPALAPSEDELQLAERFDAALERLWIAFQPIVSGGRRSLFGYEALVRSDAELGRPDQLLAAAERLARLADLGRAIRARVAAEALDAPPGALLFVNLHARDLEDPELLDPHSPLSRVARRVVLEITERTALVEVSDIGAKVERLRSLGYRLAVDDLGAGYAGLASFASIQPEVVKLDMSLVRGVNGNVLKQSVVRSMVRLAEELGILVISEGIESREERETLAALGCDLFQGYLFGKPARGFLPPVL